MDSIFDQRKGHAKNRKIEKKWNRNHTWGSKIVKNDWIGNYKIIAKKSSKMDFSEPYFNIFESLHKRMKFSIKDFFNKCDQIPSFLRIWSHLLRKFWKENFIFCAANIQTQNMSKQREITKIWGAQNLSSSFEFNWVLIF